MYYAKSTSGFYTMEIHGNDMPADAVEITPERHAELLEGQASGQQIVGDENGFPILITPEVVPYIPTKITMRQCRLQLLDDGVLDDVEAAVSAMPRAAQIEWEYGAEVERENPLVAALMVVVSWDEARADQFFTEAAAL